MILMATRNLINMVAVGATSAAALLALLAAKHFCEDADSRMTDSGATQLSSRRM
jgi:hypothetical protein